ncbi:MAG: outer rane immunogenic protein [Alphaproteobacteria bacterium]|jgi:outer membrane immunogenic protein|nr:outer rane immunogenic protein [Alphaproteobacteria bacterium]
MTKKIVLGAVAAALMAATSAHAADLPAGIGYSAPSQALVYSWMGPYLGLNLGYEWGSVSNNPTRPNGLEGGIQGGYNWQNGQYVFGVETDLQLSGADDVIAPWKFSNPWFGTTRARIGYAANNILFYGTGGLAYGSLKLDSAGLTETKTSLGWAIGAGVEMGLTPNWSAKVEYLYFSLSDRARFIGTTNGLSASLLRLGVNYHF